MKGTLFQRPFEFKLLVEGESWFQGDTVSGELVVKNHGGNPLPLSGAGIALAYGDIRKVHAKAPAAFKILQKAPFESKDELPAQGEQRRAWKFATDRNCPITDKSRSLFLLYGSFSEHSEQEPAGDKLGHLQINVTPFPVIQHFVDVWRTGFRFVVKSQKAAKNSVEIKLVPPEASTFAALEQVVLNFRFDEDTLSVNYSFAVKKVDASAGTVAMIKEQKDFEQKFERNEYLVPSGRFHHEHAEAAIRDVLDRIKSWRTGG